MRSRAEKSISVAAIAGAIAAISLLIAVAPGAGAQAKTEQLAAAREQAAAAAARESQLTALMARGEQRAAELQAKVERTQSKLARTRAQLRRSLKVLSDRLVAIYEGNSPDPTELLLSSHGFDDLANRAELLGRIQEADDALAERVRILKREVTAQLAAAHEAHAQAVAYDQRVAAARDEISAVRANAEAQAVALDSARQQEPSA